MMRRRLQRLVRRFVHDTRGTTAVETSLVIGIVLVLLFGAIDWSRYYYNRARVRSAVRRGALHAARLPGARFDSATIAGVTRAALVGTTAEQALGTVVVSRTGTVGVDPRVRVTWLAYPFTRATGLVMASGRTDTVRAEFRREQP